MEDYQRPLTQREKEVLFYITKHSFTNKQIAETLHVTHHTVKAHVSAILRKLGCKNRTDMAIYALRNGVINLHQDSTQP